MMKFIFMGSLSVVLMCLGGNYFWLVNGILVAVYLIFITDNIMFSNYNCLGSLVGVDMMGYSLIILSILLSIFMNMASQGSIYGSGHNYLFVLIYSLMFVLVVTFSVGSLFLFFFFFEFSLIPTLLIILGWGYQPERLQAGVYFLFYTMAASLPLLLSMLFVLKIYGMMNVLMMLDSFWGGMNFFLFVFLLLAFLVKLPIFFFHLWLPKAHVEAPVGGSMILAGVLLKLGGYGACRVVVYVKLCLLNFGGYFLGLSVLGMVYVGLMCCRLNDLKALVAYSSVAHMGMVIGGVMCFSFWGLEGSLLMMIGHGMASSGLFCMVNLFYERSGSRLFMINSGVISIIPGFTLLFFMLCGANMACPPTLNLLSEIFLITSIFVYSKMWILMILPFGCYLGAVFSLFLFSYSQHGKFYMSFCSYSVPNFREFHLIVLHLFPLNFIFMNIDYFLLFV